jgi:hypothetical protein
MEEKGIEKSSARAATARTEPALPGAHPMAAPAPAAVSAAAATAQKAASVDPHHPRETGSAAFVQTAKNPRRAARCPFLIPARLPKCAMPCAHRTGAFLAPQGVHPAPVRSRKRSPLPIGALRRADPHTPKCAQGAISRREAPRLKTARLTAGPGHPSGVPALCLLRIPESSFRNGRRRRAYARSRLRTVENRSSTHYSE